MINRNNSLNITIPYKSQPNLKMDSQLRLTASRIKSDNIKDKK